MRARQPDRSGHVERDGVRTYYESYGAGARALVFPTDMFVTSESWKAQVGYLSRWYRVVVLDPRGNGRSDKPTREAAYTDDQFVDDVMAVMDELAIDSAVLVGLCQSSYYALAAAAHYPERVDGVVAIGSWAADGTPRVDRGTGVYDHLDETWNAPYTDQEGWDLLNREVFLADFPRWPAFFFSQIVNDAHSTKLYEDLVGWACQSTGAAQAAAAFAPYAAETPEATAALFAQVRCPVLVIHGTRDACQAFARGAHIARMTGAELLALGGAGHVPTARDPVTVNHAIIDFVRRVDEAGHRPRREGPARVRAHLSTRRDPAPPLAEGRRVDGATTYGAGTPQVVALTPLDPALAETWIVQLRGVACHVPLLVVDAGADLEPLLEDAGVSDALLVAPPGSWVQVTGAVQDVSHLAGVVIVHTPRLLDEQPGLLEFFVHRLPRDTQPASIVRALTDVPAAEAGGRCPVVVVADDHDADVPMPVDATVTVEGGAPVAAPRPARRHRSRRVLYLSSPIGLGHVRRDLAVVEALRRREPGLRVDWLTQSPVSEFLERAGEHVHPASAWLASESGHIESEAGEHDLHAFQAIRRMDEILVNNFHVFDDLVSEREYDAWVGDEAWDLDHFLHENPGLKRAPFVWITDFVGWLPMPDGGEPEAALAADYNAEMVEHVARYPGLRDRSIFVGDPEDVIAGTLGPDLPGIREWTEQHFEFSGYVMGDRPTAEDREGLRRRLGHGSDHTVCVVSVGGSGVGEPLIRRVCDAYDACAGRVPSLRMHVVTGPRLDPETVKAPEGVTVHGFLPDLDLHHAACDIAVVQGGLSTTMELTAAGRPFLYFPLRHHFEQRYHVRHRLERHGAGRAMEYDTADPDTVADALVAELAGRPAYVPVPRDGAERAAELVAEVL